MTIEGLGKKFQDARLARGLTLDEAARLTKIRPLRLAEIEVDDFSQFPSLAYAKGFLQIYGKFLDVDVTPYLDAFETSQQMTVYGYSYLQDQPAPKPRRIRARPRAPVVRRQRSGDRSSPFPLLIAVGVIIVGFVLMRLIMNIQRIAPHQMVGVPQPTAAQSAAPQQRPPAQAPAASVAPVVQAPSRAPSSPPPAVVEAPKKSPPPVATTAAPSVAPAAATTPPAFANATAAAKASPEVRRAEPVRPEDLAKAGATTQTAQQAPEGQGPNQGAIK